MDGRHDTAASRQATRFDAIQGRFDPWLLGCMLALAALSPWIRRRMAGVH